MIKKEDFFKNLNSTINSDIEKVIKFIDEKLQGNILLEEDNSIRIKLNEQIYFIISDNELVKCGVKKRLLKEFDWECEFVPGIMGAKNEMTNDAVIVLR
jgi:hypothetical protein